MAIAPKILSRARASMPWSRFLSRSELLRRLVDDLALDLVQLLVAFELLADGHRAQDFVARQSLDALEQVLVRLDERHLPLGLADRPLDLFLIVEQRLDRLVPLEQRLENFVFGDDARAALDHDDGIAAAGKKNIDVAFLQLTLRRIDNPLPVHATDTHAGQRAVKWN